MGKPEAAREEVLTALHHAQCDDILEKLPQGADTVIGTKGVYLSGGEQQRIAIARVMLKNAPIIILDEDTACTGCFLKTFRGKDSDYDCPQAFYRNKCGSDFCHSGWTGCRVRKQPRIACKRRHFQPYVEKLSDFRAMEGNKGGAVI